MCSCVTAIIISPSRCGMCAVLVCVHTVHHFTATLLTPRAYLLPIQSAKHALFMFISCKLRKLYIHAYIYIHTYTYTYILYEQYFVFLQYEQVLNRFRVCVARFSVAASASYTFNANNGKARALARTLKNRENCYIFVLYLYFIRHRVLYILVYIKYLVFGACIQRCILFHVAYYFLGKLTM